MKISSSARQDVATLLSLLISSSMIIDTRSSCTETDVVIGGAGFAGLGAAYELFLYNENAADDDKVSFELLEADSKVGGRGEHVHWLSGAEGNPLLNVMEELFGVNVVDTELTKWDQNVYYKDDTTWNKWPEEYGKKDIPRNAWYSAYECMQEYGINYYLDHIENNPNNSSKDIGIRGALSQQCGWTNDTTIKDALEWFDIDYEYTVEPDLISLMDVPLNPFTDFQQKSTFIANTANGAVIAEKLYDTYLSGSTTLNANITKVEYLGNTDYPVKVTADVSGSVTEYCTKQMIFTGSVGVLEKRNIAWSDFDEEMDDKVKAMKTVLEMGEYHEIRLKFKDKFWDDYPFLTTPFVSRGRCNSWQNYDDIYGSNVLVCVLTTERFNELGGYDNVDENDVRALLDESFGQVYTSLPQCNEKIDMDVSTPLDSNDPDCQYEVSQLSESPYVFGSYAYWKVGGTFEDYTKFNATMSGPNPDPLIRFAGSATCFRHREFSHGAWMSGIREANYVINAVAEKDNPNPSDNLCEHAPNGGIGNPVVRSSKSQPSGGNSNQRTSSTYATAGLRKRKHSPGRW